MLARLASRTGFSAIDAGDQDAGGVMGPAARVGEASSFSTSMRATMRSSAAGSGIFHTADGGNTWTE